MSPCADRAPDVGGPLEGGDGVRRERPVLEARQVHRGVELEEVGEGGEALALVEVVGGELELVDERRPGCAAGRSRVVLQPHRRRPCAARAGPPRCSSSRSSARPRGISQLGVARDADGVAGEDLVAVVEARQVQPDHVLEQHEDVLARAGAGSATKRGSDLARDVEHGEAWRGAGRGGDGPDGDDEAEGPVARCGNGWPGSTASGVSTGSSVRRK